MDPGVSLSRLASRYGFRGKRGRGDPSSSQDPIPLARPVRARRTASSAVTANRRVARLNQILNSLVERKKLDTSILPVGGVSTTPQLFELSQIAQGDTESGRTGLKVTPQKLFIDMTFGVEEGTFDAWRVIVFRWDDNSVPTASDIISPALGTDTLIQWVNKPKYRIMDDTKFLCEGTSTGSNRFYRKTFHFPATDKIMFNGSSAGAGEWGRIYMLLVTNSQVIPHPPCSGNSRLQFMDV